MGPAKTVTHPTINFKEIDFGKHRGFHGPGPGGESKICKGQVQPSPGGGERRVFVLEKCGGVTHAPPGSPSPIAADSHATVPLALPLPKWR